MEINCINYKPLYIILLVIASACFITGIFAPIMTLEKFIFFGSEFSIYSAIKSLLLEGEVFLFLIIFLFTIIFPICKLIYLLLACFKQSKSRFIQIMFSLSHWSMLDVFVLAILLTSVKLGIMAQVDIHWGIYPFTISVVLMSLLGKLKTKGVNNE